MVFLICCLNKALQRPENKLPVTYQTFALVWTRILAWFQELYFECFYGRWVEKGGPEAREGVNQNFFVFTELFLQAKATTWNAAHVQVGFGGMV